MGRAPCCDKASVKKGPWSPEEDATLKSYIEKYGTGGNWIALPQKIGLKRCGKSCRLRWLNYLRPNIKHGGFSEEEDNIICSLYISIGSRWSIIAAQLPGRTDNDIKNYWNTRLKKKLLGSKQLNDRNQNRRAGLQKQEQAKSAEQYHINRDHNLVIGTNNTYWPDQPNAPLFNPINQSEHCINDEHYSSIRRLLVKLGGKFSDSDGSQVFDANSANLITTPNFVQANLTINEALPGSSGFNPTELDDMFSCNSVKLEGLDCFYGMESLVNNVDVSPFVNYQSMSVNYQSMMMQPCLFEEQVHHGTQ